MYRKTLSIFVALLLAGSFAYGQAKERVYGGVGYSASATTTPQEFVFEQQPGAELVSNGDFATTNNWTLDTGWAIGSGDATFTSTEGATGGAAQASISVTTGTQYRLTYTVSEVDGTISITPTLGNDSLTARTANGTYTEDFYFAGTATLDFEAITTGAATGTIDNVYLYAKPNKAWVDVLNLSGTSSMATVHFLFNCDAEDFTNAYNNSRTMQLTSDNSPLSLDYTGQKTPIYKMWYRVATGTESFTLNAR